MVTDTLSRVPGSEMLTSFEVCSFDCTLGILHVDDVPAKLCTRGNDDDVAV